MYLLRIYFLFHFDYLNKYLQFFSGRPKPVVRWYQSGISLPTASEVSSGSTVTSTVILEALDRSDNGLLLTCEASNNNISKPVRHSVSMLMNRKFFCGIAKLMIHSSSASFAIVWVKLKTSFLLA